MSRAQWTRFIGTDGRAPNKYGAAAETVDGIRFDSRREAARYQELKTLEAAGAIVDLKIHPRYPLYAIELWDGGDWVNIGRYTADFQYCDVATGEIVIEDVKTDATRTTAYRLRKRIVEAGYGIQIREV